MARAKIQFCSYDGPGWLTKKAQEAQLDKHLKNMEPEFLSSVWEAVSNEARRNLMVEYFKVLEANGAITLRDTPK